MVRERRHQRRAQIHHKARLDPGSVPSALVLGQELGPEQSKFVPSRGPQ